MLVIYCWTLWRELWLVSEGVGAMNTEKEKGRAGKHGLE